MSKITVTGSLGNISSRLTERLTAKGHQVTVISHDPKKTKDIEGLKATAAIGSIEDYNFLLRAFDQADAVYTMIPPNYVTDDLKGYIRSVGEKYAGAIAETGVRHIVNLSSIGAHDPKGSGPTGSNHFVEKKMDEINGTNVLHLRPGMFYTNFFGAMPMIKHQHIIGNNFDASVNMVLTHPQDIAAAAAEALDSLYFTGTNVRYLASDEKNGGQIASILGQALNIPDLSWMEFSDDALLQGMLQNGLSEQMATIYIMEIGISLRNGTLFEDYRLHKSVTNGKTNFETFAREFAAVYKNS
ncbi:NmrA family NAD(P)-binding protein [Flavitalea flava]